MDAAGRHGVGLIGAICLAWLSGAESHAGLLEVIAVAGVPGRIIAAPPMALDEAYASSDPVGFDERRNVRLKEDLAVDGGTIPKGTRINSHMILFNVPDGEAGGVAENIWVFSGPVLGVMSDVDGRLEAASAALGAPGTVYPAGGYPLRGLEEHDWYDGVGTTRLRVHMQVWQPGDWIRVITGEQPVAKGRPRDGTGAARPAG